MVFILVTLDILRVKNQPRFQNGNLVPLNSEMISFDSPNRLQDFFLLASILRIKSLQRSQKAYCRY